ncbi:MAG: flavodoxin [Candidatus Falkowbacteria bacterium]
MKTLILYYSRTGTTRKLAEYLAGKLGADLEKVKDTVDRSGAMGYLSAGKDATLRKLTKIEPIHATISNYDLVILATPIWSWNLSVPIRTLAEEYKTEFKNIALVCTMGGSGDLRAKKDLEVIINKKIELQLALTTKEVVMGTFESKANDFIHLIG